MLCAKCNNLLNVKKISNSFQYMCTNCNASYEIKGYDTLLYEEYNEEKPITKNGKDIFYLTCNPREIKDCPSCKSPIVSYERTPKSFIKIYGCKCGNTWSEKSSVEANITGGSSKISLEMLLKMGQ